jgi:hypothetical protein
MLAPLLVAILGRMPLARDAFETPLGFRAQTPLLKRLLVLLATLLPLPECVLLGHAPTSMVASVGIPPALSLNDVFSLAGKLAMVSDVWLPTLTPVPHTRWLLRATSAGALLSSSAFLLLESDCSLSLSSALPPSAPLLLLLRSLLLLLLLLTLLELMLLLFLRPLPRLTLLE